MPDARIVLREIHTGTHWLAIAEREDGKVLVAQWAFTQGDACSKRDRDLARLISENG